MNKTLKKCFLLVIVLTSLAILFSVSASALLRGDIDEDGKVTPSDARIALRISVGLAKSLDPKTDYSTREKDIADMDMNLSVDASDARKILRTAVKLDQVLAYYTYTVTTAPTCTKPGLYERISTEPTVASTDFSITQEVPALGHDFSVLVYTKKPGTCTSPGFGTYQCSRCTLTIDKDIIVEHVWVDATCITARKCANCGVVNGSPLGHRTRLGVCSRCQQYQGLLLDYYRTKVAAPLNNGVNSLQMAYNILFQNRGRDITNKTLTFTEAKPAFIEAYNYYYEAYDACADYPEFAEAKKIIYTICMNLLKNIVYTGDVTEKNGEEIFDKWAIAATEIMNSTDGYNVLLKAETDKYKDPATITGEKINTATNTDAVSGTGKG